MPGTFDDDDMVNQSISSLSVPQCSVPQISAPQILAPVPVSVAAQSAPLPSTSVPAQTQSTPERYSTLPSLSQLKSQLKSQLADLDGSDSFLDELNNEMTNDVDTWWKAHRDTLPSNTEDDSDAANQLLGELAAAKRSSPLIQSPI